MDNVKSQEANGSMGLQKSHGYGVKSAYGEVDGGSRPYNNIVDFEEYSRYIEDRVRQLESRNDILREQCSKIERDKRYIETQKTKFEREVRALQSEIDTLKTPPNLLGTIESIIGNGKVVIRASTGVSFLVSSSQLIPEDTMKVGAQVALNMHTLAIIEVVPKADNPYVAAFEVESDTNVSYDDIGGLYDQIRDIREIIELPLTKPELFKKIGIKPPKGVLLFGPPGTGKTLLARAVAHSTDATFIRIVGSEFVQKYIGEGARVVRDLFSLAKRKAPSIIFIDELDSIGAKRLDDSSGGDREVQRTLMQLLAEMDGFDDRGDVKIIAATNRPDILDSALLRPGRFDRFIEVPLPDSEARIKILEVLTRNLNCASDIDYDKLVSMLEGTNGADIAAIVSEAGMFAIREERERIESEDFTKSIMKLLEPQEKSKKLAEYMFG